MLGMLTHVQAWQHAKNNAFQKCTRSLMVEEKTQSVHPSCASSKKTEDVVKCDSMLQKCVQSHPQFYFNNLGLIHLKLKKYGLATYYLAKAVKTLERSEEKKISLPQGVDKISSPQDHVSNLVSQRQHEVVYNMGLSLFKSGKFFEAFKCFEKVSLGHVSNNPRMWFNMAICAVNLHEHHSRQAKSN